MKTIEKLDMNVKQVNSDFVAIKNKIVEKGVEVADGTRTAEYAEKIDEVFEAGKKAERTAFWDTNLQNGNRTDFQRAYAGGGWSKKNFLPNHDIKPSSAYYAGAYMFFQFGFGATESLDLVELAQKQGIVFDFSQVKEFAGTFSSSNISRYGVIDMRNANSCSGAFSQYEPYALIQIDEIISAETTPWLPNSFRYEYNLQEVRFSGVIAASTGIPNSGGLSKESIISIINALSSTTTGLTFTLQLGAVNRNFETSTGASDGSTSAEWTTLRDTKSNWTIALA